MGAGKVRLKSGALPVNQGRKGLLQGMQLIHPVKNERREVMERIGETETVNGREERVNEMCREKMCLPSGQVNKLCLHIVFYTVTGMNPRNSPH